MARRGSTSVKSFLPLVILLIVGAIALWYFINGGSFDPRSRAALITNEVDMLMRTPAGESSGIYAAVNYVTGTAGKNSGEGERPRMSIWLGPEQQPEYPSKDSEVKKQFLRITYQYLYAGSCVESGNKILDIIEGYIYISDEGSASDSQFRGSPTLSEVVQKLDFQTPLDFMTSPNYSIRAYSKSDGSLYACADMSTKISTSPTAPPTSAPSASAPPGGTPPPTNTPKPSSSPWPPSSSSQNQGGNWPKQSPTYNLMTATGTNVGTVNLKSEGIIPYFLTKWTVAVRNLIKPVDDARNMRVFVADTLCSQTPNSNGLTSFSLVWGSESTKSTMDRKIGKLLKAMTSDSPASVRLYFTDDSSNQPTNELLYACADYTTKVE